MHIKRVLFVLVLIFGLTACSDSSDKKADGEDLDNLNETGMPIVEETITLDFFAGKAPATNDDWNDVLIYNKYEEMSNLDINWEMVPFDSMEEKRNLALSGGELPDAFHSAGMPTQDLLKYGQEQGILIPLNDLIDEYAPNFKQIMEDYPELEEAITLPDGNIYSFPLVVDPEFDSYLMYTMQWINQDWLDELDMDMPETTDEYYEFLKASKEAGLGGEDGAGFGGDTIDFLYAYLLGSYGLANHGTTNGSFDLDPDSGDVRFYPISDEYKSMLEYLHKLWDEELMAQNLYTMDDDQYRSNVLEGLYGSTNFWSPEGSMGEEAGEIYTGMPVLEGPDGDKMLVDLLPIAANPGSFVITEENDYPEATVRWIDYFYGEEGILLYFMGVEGETYEINEDGEAEYMDHILNNDEDLSITQEQAKYLALPGSNPPSVMKEEYFVGSETTDTALEAAERLKPDVIEDQWPAFIYTEEENKIQQNVGTDIDKYVAEMRDNFITGKESFDNWDKYVETIEGMHLVEYKGIVENALERLEEQ